MKKKISHEPCNRPLVKHLVRVDDQHGWKGACWYYAVLARCEHEAIELATKVEKLKGIDTKYMQAFVPQYKNEDAIGSLTYHEGDKRL